VVPQPYMYVALQTTFHRHATYLGMKQNQHNVKDKTHGEETVELVKSQFASFGLADKLKMVAR